MTLTGSPGSLIALLLWVYYTSPTALGGAELTREIVGHRERAREQGAQEDWARLVHAPPVSQAPSAIQ